jgi:hypothetical protein
MFSAMVPKKLLFCVFLSWALGVASGGVAIQVLFLGVLALLVYETVATGLANMRAHHIPLGFSFWNEPAGFDIDQHLIPYSAGASRTRAGSAVHGAAVGCHIIGAGVGAGAGIAGTAGDESASPRSVKSGRERCALGRFVWSAPRAVERDEV